MTTCVASRSALSSGRPTLCDECPLGVARQKVPTSTPRRCLPRAQVFNAVTLKEIAQLLNKSEWCMLVSYRDPAEWRRHGLQGFQARARQVHRLVWSLGAAASTHLPLAVPLAPVRPGVSNPPFSVLYLAPICAESGPAVHEHDGRPEVHCSRVRQRGGEAVRRDLCKGARTQGEQHSRRTRSLVAVCFLGGPCALATAAALFFPLHPSSPSSRRNVKEVGCKRKG